MNTIEKSESIRDGLRKGFQSGTSKLAQRKCYGYDVGPDGELTINPDEAATIRWIFDQYLSGSSLGAIAAGRIRDLGHWDHPPLGNRRFVSVSGWLFL